MSQIDPERPFRDGSMNGRLGDKRPSIEGGRSYATTQIAARITIPASPLRAAYVDCQRLADVP
jgi:hypothetical protein